MAPKKLSWVGQTKCLYERKLSRLPGLPYLPRWDNFPPPPPRETSWWSLCKLFLGTFQRNRWKIRLPRVTWGEGGLGYPRSHKWGLKPRQYCLILQPISQLNAQPGFETWFACHHSSLTIKHCRKEVDLLLLCGCIYVRKLVFPL